MTKRKQAEVVTTTRERHCANCKTLVGYYDGPHLDAIWHDVDSCETTKVTSHTHARYYCREHCPSQVGVCA